MTSIVGGGKYWNKSSRKIATCTHRVDVFNVVYEKQIQPSAVTSKTLIGQLNNYGKISIHKTLFFANRWCIIKSNRQDNPSKSTY